MNRTFALSAAVIAAVVAVDHASASFTFSTDRFGYTGTVTRHDTLADANAGANVVETIVVGNRDMSLYFDDASSIIMGSWWYTTEENTNGLPKDDPDGNRLYSGWGNTRGNSGTGFIQMYDLDSSTVDSLSANFTNFDGTHYTRFDLSVLGSDTGPDEFGRFWTAYQGSGADRAVYHSYALNLSATGLEGVELGGGVIEATNHPTGVTGSFTGVFENTSVSYPVNNGFYRFSLDLDMVNWAFAQGDEALNGDFYESYFSIPEPASLSLLGLGGMGLMRRRR